MRDIISKKLLGRCVTSQAKIIDYLKIKMKKIILLSLICFAATNEKVIVQFDGQ